MIQLQFLAHVVEELLPMSSGGFMCKPCTAGTLGAAILIQVMKNYRKEPLYGRRPRFYRKRT